MKTFNVDLKQTYGTAGGTLACNIADLPFDQPTPWQRPAVIVVPGGGYEFVSIRESEPVALEFSARGFQTFVLTYNIQPQGFSYPTQLVEVACAVDYVRKNATELHVDPNRIYVVGFSAGGHLVANLAVQWQEVSDILGKQLDCRPTAVGLSYAVINHKVGHEGTYRCITSFHTQQEREQLYQKLSLDLHVTPNTPPAFLWTTTQDTCVDSQNSLLYALACAKNGVRYELHAYASGDHGLSTVKEEINAGIANTDIVRARKWIDDCVAFFNLF